MKRAISNTIFTLYIIIAIFVTICLLSYNDYKVSEIGDKSIIIVSDKKMEPVFNKGDLIIVTNDESDDFSIGEQILYYNTYNEEIKVRLGTITDIEETSGTGTTYSIDNGNAKISSEFLIGKLSNTKYMKSVGTILGIFESKWGFLFLIVLPALLAFVNQLVVVVSGIKGAKND